MVNVEAALRLWTPPAASGAPQEVRDGQRGSGLSRPGRNSFRSSSVPCPERQRGQVSVCFNKTLSASVHSNNQGKRSVLFKTEHIWIIVVLTGHQQRSVKVHINVFAGFVLLLFVICCHCSRQPLSSTRNNKPLTASCLEALRMKWRHFVSGHLFSMLI